MLPTLPMPPARHKGMKSTKSTKPMSRDPGEVGALFGVMTELKEILETENDFLRRGMPAALSDMTERKTSLAETYTTLSHKVLARYADDIISDPALQSRLVQAGEELRGLTHENMLRLNSALEATRRRIDAVMEAIQAEEGGDRAYSQKSLPFQASRFVNPGINLKI